MSGKNRQNRGPGSARKLNRNGIPVFDREEDLFFIFKDLPLQDRAGEQGKTQVAAARPASVQRQKTNTNDRNGVPILSRSTSLAAQFANKDRKVEDDEDFSTLLERSLKGKNGAALLRDKREKDLPEPVPLKKQLKRYPPPEEELDLHGDTAVRAVVRSESFVRTAWRAGEFTVSIVVGKGLHSESGAVLPDVVEDLLVKLKKEGVVLWFEWDRNLKSLSGAVIVYLKQF